jgi:hypothetical protein
VDSFKAIRKEHNPLAPKHHAKQYALLLTPFAQLIEPFEQRAHYLRAAVKLALAHLSEHDRIALGSVLLRESGRLSNARQQAFDALAAAEGYRGTSPKSVENSENAILMKLAEILGSEGFADEFARTQTLHPRPNSAPLPQPGIVPLRWCWAIDFVSLTRVVWHKAVKLRAVLPEQRMLEHRYHDELAGKPNKPIDVFTKGHSYHGTVPDTAMGRPGWWVDFIYFGHMLAVGETARVAWKAEFAKAEPFLALTPTHQDTKELYLAIRMPPGFRHHPASAETFADPYNSRILIGEPEEVNPGRDGWVVKHYTNLALGLQYGLYFYGLDFYND